LVKLFERIHKIINKIRKTKTNRVRCEKLYPIFIYYERNEVMQLCKNQKLINPIRQKKTDLLNKIKKENNACNKCPLAKLGRKQVVFGKGNPNAKIMFIGEGPGKDEDLLGIPFIGRSGKILTKIIDETGLKREDVYISNVVKCRPPNNRTPLPLESQICKKSILLKEIEIIKPKVICCLGSSATQAILSIATKISKARGNFFDFSTPENNIKIMSTFHPAYLIRNPKAKKLVKEDISQIIIYLKKKLSCKNIDK
jgi:uracil-DNA glycosylase